MTSDRRAALVEKVAKPIYDDLLASRGGPHTERLCDWLDYKSRKYAAAAIDLIRAEVLEEALTALYSVPRWDREIFDSLTQTADGSLIYINEADAAIRALKGDNNG